MNLPFESVQDAVAELRRSYFPTFHVLPYNRWDVEHSQHWWLSPTSDKAAFRYAKVIFTTSEWVPAGEVFCGFNVEKGQREAGVGNPNWVMTEDWFWHRFLELANVPLLSAVEEARDALGEQPQLFVACGIPAPGARWDHVRFKIVGDRLQLQDFQLGDGKLNEVASSENIANFSTAIRALDSTDTAWHWTDLLVGHSFTVDVDGGDDLEKCSAMLRPFERWMNSFVS